MVIVLVVLGFSRPAAAASCRSRTRATSIGSIILPDGATLERTRQGRPPRCRRLLAEHPAVEHVFVVNGFDLIGGGNKTNAGTMFITLEALGRAQASPRDELAKYVAQKGGVDPRRHRDRLQPAADPRPGHGRAASRSTCRIAPTAIRKRLGEVMQRLR